MQKICRNSHIFSVLERVAQRVLGRAMILVAMKREEFDKSIALDAPPDGLSVPLQALWFDAKGNWEKAHDLVDDLETQDGMAVHAYLHRKSGETSNSEYWYERCGREFQRPTFEAEWQALVEALIKG